MHISHGMFTISTYLSLEQVGYSSNLECPILHKRIYRSLDQNRHMARMPTPIW